MPDALASRVDGVSAGWGRPVTEGPPVTLLGGHPDVLGDDADAAADGSRWPLRLTALAVAAGVGFAAAKLVDRVSADGSAPAALALVSGRQPYLDATAGDAPTTSMEVVLVNTGSDVLVLDGRRSRGTGLGWEADRPLEPGRQAAPASAGGRRAPGGGCQSGSGAAEPAGTCGSGPGSGGPSYGPARVVESRVTVRGCSDSVTATRRAPARRRGAGRSRPGHVGERGGPRSRGGAPCRGDHPGPTR